MRNITKEEFDIAYNKYPPNKWVKFAFNNFSSESEKRGMSIGKIVYIFLLVLFGLGFFGVVFDLNRKFILLLSLAYGICLALLVLYLTSAVILNNIRIRKIAKELNVSIKTYNELVEMYY